MRATRSMKRRCRRLFAPPWRTTRRRGRPPARSAPGRDQSALEEPASLARRGQVCRSSGRLDLQQCRKLVQRHAAAAVSLLKISRDRNGALELTGRAWRDDGSLSARYWSEAVKEKEGSSGVFFYWKGERPLDPNAPQLDEVGEIRVESGDRASGYFTTRADTDLHVIARTA